MNRPPTIAARRSKWERDLARERRQHREALARNDRRAAEHARQIGILECLLADLETRHHPPAGAPVQTELSL